MTINVSNFPLYLALLLVDMVMHCLKYNSECTHPFGLDEFYYQKN